jgi:predicted RNA-binding Zn-ribbon protein involved in translation (DUF1610 family)
MEAHPQDERNIREYVLAESEPGEIVRSAEKVHTEHVAGREYDVWDVRTRRQRWWVITNPTNLYLQRDVPSMDQAITLHIGLTERVMAKQKPWGGQEEQGRLAGAWRRWQQASDAMDAASEAEDFQAVGMRCREALLSFIHGISDPSMVPEAETPPKRSDFIHWSEKIADHVAAGQGNDAVRAYLKNLARASWELAQWLTHAKNAVLMDAKLTTEGTGHTLYAFGLAIIRKEKGVPDRCPQCASYRITRDWRPEFGREHEYVTRCEACEWEEVPVGIAPDWDLVPEYLRPEGV